MGLIPWLLGLLTGAWFGWLGYRNGRGWPLWSLAGGVLGLVTAEFVFGLRHATCLPMSEHHRLLCQLEATGATLVILAGISGLIFWSFRPRRRAAELGDANGTKNAP